jgi:U4/U6.U5 tri-snRNP-associated protein 1
VEPKAIEKNEIDEMLVGKGIANALKVFRQRGMLGSAPNRGRTKDQTLEKQLTGFEKVKGEGQDQDRVQLQYFDKSGHSLTLKEAYRQMCWKFHGRMPSHKKREKMAAKEQA